MKPKRIVNIKLTNSLRARSCTVDYECMGSTVGHHVKSVGSGGDDVGSNLIPLCTKHHNEVHNMGMFELSRQYHKVHYWLMMNKWEFNVYLSKWIRPDIIDLKEDEYQPNAGQGGLL